MKNTKIEWAHHTVNFWWGCTKVSPACAHCYAETLARIWSKGRATWGESGERWLRIGAATKELLMLEKAAAMAGVRWRVFINSMSDTFEDRSDLDSARLVIAALAPCVPHLDLLLLTKRPDRVRDLVPLLWLQNWPANVWLGTTVEDQKRADERIPALLAIPARVRFLSCEPLLGPVEFSNVTHRSDWLRVLGKPALAGIHWVIVGGESGGGARPMEPQWARSVRDQCAAVSVPFFFKQWGEWAPGDPLLDGAPNYRAGKKAAGRVLDGCEHNEVPA